MAAGSTQEIIREIVQNMEAVADKPCVNTYCGSCDGVCAKKNCGGYMSEDPYKAT